MQLSFILTRCFYNVQHVKIAAMEPGASLYCEVLPPGGRGGELDVLPISVYDRDTRGNF